MKNDPNVLATKGQIPNYTTQVDKQNWLSKLDNSRILLDNDTNMKLYLYPKGPVIGYSWDANGYLEVTFYKGLNVTDSQINEIYNLISKRANEVSVQEVPVVFSRSDLFKDEVSGYDSYYRPINGAIKVTGETGSWGTIGYAAKTSSGTKGYVTVQHLGTYVGYDMYQPASDAAGSVSKISGHYADACFVPYSNVAAKIHIGGGSAADVYNYVSTIPSSGWVNWKVYMSGAASGVKSGYIKGAGLTLTEGGGPYYNKVKANYSSTTGDSGAPIYRISSGNYIVLGIHKGTFNGYKWFSPVSGINSDLSVLPIKA